MAQFLDEAAITGVASAAAPAASPPPKGAQFLDEAAITGIEGFERGGTGGVKAVAADSAKFLGGNVGNAIDMLLGVPAMLAGAVMHVGGRVGAQIAEPGISQKEAAQAGAEYSSKIPDWLRAPVRSAVEKLGPEYVHYYDQSGLGQVFGLITKGVEKGSELAEHKSGVPAEDVKASVEAIMGVLGAKANVGIAKTVASKVKAAVDARKAAADYVPPGPDTSVAYDTALPRPDKAALDAKIAEAKKAKQAAASKLKEAAKFQKMAEKLDEGDPLRATVQERADLAVREHSELLREQAREAQAIDEAARAEKAADLEARVGGEAYEPGAPAKAPSPGQLHREALDVQTIAQTPGHLRTPEQMIRLRGALNALKQGGFSDAKVAAGILGGTLAGAAFFKLYQTWAYEQGIKEQQKRLDEDYNLWDHSNESKKLREWEYERDENPQPPVMPLPGSGGKLFVADAELEAEAGLGMLLAGAVKGKGGMWHPEAVERLSRPLADKLVRDMPQERGEPGEARGPGDAYWKKAEPLHAWSDSRIRSYLNKHAGTEGDPLREVELPSGKKWGEVTEELINSKPAKEYTDGETGRILDLPKVPPEEPVWDMASYGRKGSVAELKDYLSHVGDYLRQNVAPEKLGQYDLVRAVKETAANDARMAKEMEKAAAASMKDMPVYKDYGDGMKWVELKLPEKLTEEQARGVKDSFAVRQSGHGVDSDAVYVVVDNKGAPLENSYTGRQVTGATPEEAHLAGQLAEEGNQMGHCVGGYCADVASGQTKILSLRDAKGRSHVTVEITSPQEGLKIPELPVIQQIKGKQNRAPNAEYLPYVQDLVRGKEAKWGDVGDIQNTGLTKIDPELMNVNSPHVGKSYLTEGELHDATFSGHYQPNPPRSTRQRGSADPRLLAGIAAVGAGALIGSTVSDKSTLGGAILGALVGGIIAGSKGVRQAVDDNLGNISTTLRGIDPALERRARAVALNTGIRSQQAADQIRPFLQAAGKLSSEQKAELKLALLNSDAATVKALPGLRSAYEKVEQLIAGTKKELQALGRFGEGVVDYFPRVVKDFDGLKKSLGQEAQKGMDKVLAEAEGEMLRKKNRPLTDVERSLVIDHYLYAPERASSLPGYAKGRKIKEVPPELQKFYEEPGAALMRYISGVAIDVESARFFGRDIKVSAKGGQKFTDVDSSIGSLVERLAREGKIDAEGAKVLRDNLRGFFVEGQQSPKGWLQDLRNYTNAGLLGDLSSAATQTADSLMVIAYHGVKPMLEGTIEAVRGKALKPSDLGIANKITEELSTERFSGKVLHHILRPVFGRIDAVGKQANIAATLASARDLVATPRGIEAFKEKWGDYFGDDFPQLVKDLQARQQSGLVKELAYGDLSDRQPISMLEMPLNYAKNPDLRLAWQLKSWMLKQIDLVRREAVQKIMSGEPKQMAQGAKALATLGAAYALSAVPANAIKDWMSLRPADPFDKSKLLENVMQTFGVNRYSSDRLAQGNLQEVIAGTVLPPAIKAFAEPALRGKPEQYARNIPFIGREFYNIQLGGNEAKAKVEAQRLKRQLRDAREAANPALREERLRRQEAKRQKDLSKYKQ